MIVVADTTPFSELAKIGQMNLLSDVFGQIIIPQEVYNEITSGKHPAAIALPLASWVEVRSVTDSQKVANLQTATNLDLGESAAIILAEELGADYLLIDEIAARRIAKSRSLPIIGLVGMLLLAKQKGLISNVKSVLDNLMANGTRISQRLYQYALITAQE
jgi:predicted nucleic acid-binding protein